MPEIVYTPDRNRISAVRIVPASPQYTTGRNPVQAVRLINAVAGDVYTPAGFPVRAVRLVDAAGSYTTSQTPITTQPEIMFTPDRHPIEPVCLIADGSPEVVWTVDGRPIEAVRLVDASGNSLAALSEAALWAAAVVTNGGTVSAARQAIVEQFIVAEKASGMWELTDDYWPLWAENAPQALTSLKQRRLTTAVAAPVFTADRGYAFDGATQYLNTGFICTTHAVAMTGNNQRLASYQRTESAFGTFYSAGAQTSSNQQIALRPRQSSGSMTVTMNAGGVNIALPVGTAIGYSVGSRADGGTTIRGYKNGAATVTGVATTPGSLQTTHTLFIAAIAAGGSPVGFLAAQLGFVCIGAPLSAVQEAAQYANVQAWATAVGANV